MPVIFDNSMKSIKNANVIISGEGLSVFHYNKENTNWEAIRQRNLSSHDLKITIKRHLNGKTEKIAEFTDLNKNEKFFIKTSKAQPLAINSIREGEKDIKQVLDLSEMRGSRLFNTNHDLDLSFLSIPDCVLYSQNVPDEIYEIQISDKKSVFRKTTNIVGADMICADGSALEIFTTEESNLISPLLIEEGAVYQIIFDTSCHDPNQFDTDFRHHYDLLSVSPRAVVSLFDGGDPNGGEKDNDGGSDDDEGDETDPPPTKSSGC